jgi:hypothetical protein
MKEFMENKIKNKEKVPSMFNARLSHNYNMAPLFINLSVAVHQHLF